MSRKQENRFGVAVCDDQKITHTIVESYLDEWAKEQGEEYEMFHFYSGEEVLSAPSNFDVLFLDVCMPGIDGIETAYRLNVAERKFKIVILTSFEKTFKEAFRVGAYRFVTKPIHKEEIWEALSAVKRSLVGRQTVDVYRDKKKYSIRQKNIFYISGRGSETEVFTKASSYRSDYSLAEWERRLDEGMFYRCHRSYIVNLSKVEKIVDEKIHLSDGEVVLLSRRRRKDVEEKFEEYGLYYH